MKIDHAFPESIDSWERFSSSKKLMGCVHLWETGYPTLKEPPNLIEWVLSGNARHVIDWVKKDKLENG